MSMVTVHGPNTMYTTGAGTPIKDPSGTIQSIQSPTNGLSFNFSVVNPGANPATCFDWTFTGPGNPVAQADRFNGTVVFTGPGAGTIICTVTGATPPPANATYTQNVTAVAGAPRMVEGESAPTSSEAPAVSAALPYDPADHTVPEVVTYAEEHPDEVEAIYAAEEAGKGRTTLLSQLEALLPA
jgi:hypothetical protein